MQIGNLLNTAMNFDHSAVYKVLHRIVLYFRYIDCMVLIDLKTKPCPFCAETIQAAAVKCRYCGEFLNTAKARALQENQEAQSQEDTTEETKPKDDILFAARPSFFALSSTYIKTGIIFAILYLIIKFPIEETINGNLGIKIEPDIMVKIGFYRIMSGWALIGIIALGLFIKTLNLKMIYYEVTPDRIEWSRGMLDRKVDNIDMFRVVDLKLRRNIIDCILGVGKVVLITNDKSDPGFAFEKIRHSRQLYDIIKKASLDADRRTGVVHLE
jgi:hypothetical protein